MRFNFNTCLLSCNDRPLVMDNHPSWTSSSLCEEAVGHRGPCPWTWGLEHTKQHWWLVSLSYTQPCFVLGLAEKNTIQPGNVFDERNKCVRNLPILTSTHGARWGRPLGWRSSISYRWSSLHWRGASGRHPLEEGVCASWVIVVWKTRFFRLRDI